ncbi:MAG: hypothetical protein AB7G12_12605 [Thermoanaerobaculia bacterium]
MTGTNPPPPPLHGLPLHAAKAIAVELRNLLEPACAQIEIAGSIRRNARQVGDIEIVCQPRIEDAPGQLFSNAQESKLERRLKTLFELSDRLSLDPELKRNGPRYKRLLYRGTPIDLFCVAPPAQWGALLAIRTGPAGFSKLLVTKREFGGAMPAGIEQRDGHLVRRSGGILEPVETPSEAEYFRVLGIPCFEPQARTEANLLRYLRQHQPPEPQYSRTRSWRPR